MAMVSMGPILLLLLMSTGGQSTDLVSMLAPQDYFKMRGIEVSIDTMVELAAKDPVDGQTQLAQLLALRTLGEDGNFKKAANYESQRKVLEDIAAGRKAQDKLGFSKEYAQRALALIDGTKPPSLAPLDSRADGLAWFPASATFVAGIESRPSSQTGLFKSPVPELLKKMPPEMQKEFYKIAESLGNVQIQRMTAAFVDEGMDKGRNFVRLTGRFNHAWVGEIFKTKGLDRKEHEDPNGMTISLFTSSGRGPDIALVGDRDLLIAGFTRGGKDQEVLEQALALREKKQANAGTGALKTILEKIPVKSVAFMAGEFPEDFRKDGGRTFGAFPKKVTAHLDRAATGFDFILEAGLEDEEQANTFVKTAGKLRMDGLDALQKAPEIPIPGVTLGELKNMLNSLQFEAKGTGVNVRMLISDGALNMVPYFMLWTSEVEKKGN